MHELIKPKNFTQNLNFKMSNMNMNIKIEYNKRLNLYLVLLD
jgi:A/G-specific adenine glycosylase